jgi:hypothetical protein
MRRILGWLFGCSHHAVVEVPARALMGIARCARRAPRRRSCVSVAVRSSEGLMDTSGKNVRQLDPADVALASTEEGKQALEDRLLSEGRVMIPEDRPDLIRAPRKERRAFARAEEKRIRRRQRNLQQQAAEDEARAKRVQVDLP